MGKQCRDVACYVWEQGKMREMRKMGKMGKMGDKISIAYSLFPVPCSLFPNK
jgi:hypothetical protein